MSELNKLELNWIDSSNEDQREHFLDALNSYLLFKKDSLDKCNLLIEENPNFNAPKLLKIIKRVFKNCLGIYSYHFNNVYLQLFIKIRISIKILKSKFN